MPTAHSGVANLLSIVGFLLLPAIIMNSSIFWDTTDVSEERHLYLHGLRISQARKEQEACSMQRDYFLLVPCLAYSSETSGDFHRTQRYVPDDTTLHLGSPRPMKPLSNNNNNNNNNKSGRDWRGTKDTEHMSNPFKTSRHDHSTLMTVEPTNHINVKLSL
jgi:hypothetical protein